ncbi:Extracellular_nuclease [Hexamita inflata]|uniref:Extracellular nuclease n=1 Tax=Hexamita inflata TaxID=28002 RepID=A0AA86PJG6_9EUKA|nr:Extracellular nuclease [Hexamita inflata]
MLCAIVLTELFPGKYGKDLRILLKDYTAENATQLGYNRAREYMYGYIYNDPDLNALTCIYTGTQMSCPYNSNSVNCDKEDNLNCEHTVPQSFFGKNEPMRSDLHHLRPTGADVNAARSNFPFNQLEDKYIDEYYGINYQVQQTKPSDVQNWSKLDEEHAFEPRDAQKGDTARAVSYFYVRYPNKGGNVNRVFQNVDYMIEWDEQFPPTELQQQQYNRAVEIQGNKNPFQEERGLVARAYCDFSKKYPCSRYQ